MRNLFELENEDHYKAIRCGNICSSSCKDYESNGDID